MTPACPICRKPVGDQPVDRTIAPFCSKRCADIDLGRWLTTQYVLPGRDGEALAPADAED